jgi:hypothetical protein
MLTAMQSALVRVNVVATVLFAAIVAVAVVARDQRWAQVLIAVSSLVLFAAGVASTLGAYVAALEKSRTDEVGVANLFLLSGETATPPVKRTMLGAWAVQIAAGVAGAAVGAKGLGERDLNALAFGVLVPMFGIGMNGMWAVRYGSFGPRVERSTRPTNRKIR